jgi:hypothetical protein
VIPTFAPAQRVVHSARPEWGVGTVLRAEPADVDGVRCQRLTVKFDRAGIKTLLTNAGLLSQHHGPAPRLSEPEVPNDPFSGEPDYKAMLVEIPEAARDPFVTAKKRLAATLDLYRFTGTGGSLLDWAAMQTKLKDPLSKFARHELEQQFQRFQRQLDEHLRKILKDAKKEDPAGLGEVVAAASAAAKHAVRRADASR